MGKKRKLPFDYPTVTPLSLLFKIYKSLQRQVRYSIRFMYSQWAFLLLRFP